MLEDGVEPRASSRKVLVVTLIGRVYNHNYGAILQAFALQRQLRDLGFESDLLDFSPVYRRARSSEIVRTVKAGKFTSAAKEFLVGVVSSFKQYERIVQVRKKKASAFKKSFLRFTDLSYGSLEELEANAEILKQSYDVFLVGSDQVWNPMIVGENLPVYLLSFLKGVRKISYASSVSSEIKRDLYSLYVDSLREFSHISVRENESALELEKVLGFKPRITVDPTLLLKPSDWLMLVKKPEVELPNDFFFVYDLFRSSEILPVVEKLSRKLGLQYVNFAPISAMKKWMYNNLVYTCFKDDPQVFLWLLSNAKFVITSSFHGAVFSILFKKPFIGVLLNKPHRLKQNGRIIHLLGQLDLMDRMLTDPRDILKKDLFENINWGGIEKKLQKLRDDSLSWLRSALDNEFHCAPSTRKNVSDVQNCAGCFSCQNICPENAIEMITSKEGFYVPKVSDDNCVLCGFCLRVCPVKNLPKLTEQFSSPRSYAAWSIDDSVRLMASSGGIYPELARFFLKKGGIVVAVKWNSEWLPEHVLVRTLDELNRTVGSKYVQSRLDDIYKSVETLVKLRKSVLFVGLPCQVAGIKKFLEVRKIDESNIYTIDLICFGVASTAVFRKYLQEIFGKDNITSISFRSKLKGWTRSYLVIRSKESVYAKRFDEDCFGSGFLKRVYLNLVCYNCPFSRLPRIGDLTLGDFWGVPKYLKDEKGVSLVLVNSQKGNELLTQLIEIEKRITAVEVPLEVALIHNPRITTGKRKVPIERAKFFTDLQEKPWRYLCRTYIKPPTRIEKLVRALWNKCRRFFSGGR